MYFQVSDGHGGKFGFIEPALKYAGVKANITDTRAQMQPHKIALFILTVTVFLGIFLFLH